MLLNVQGIMVGLGHLYEGIQYFITFDTLNKCCSELLLSDNEDEVGLKIARTPKHELVSPVLRPGNVTILEILKIVNCSCLATLWDWMDSLTSLNELQNPIGPELKSLLHEGYAPQHFNVPEIDIDHQRMIIKDFYSLIQACHL